MKKLAACLLALLTLCALATAGQGQEYVKFSGSFFGTFDTLITIQGYALEEETFDLAFQEARRQFERLHQVFDGYNAHEGVKNLYHLNREAPKGAPVQVEPELMDLLLFCAEKQPLTNGTVNVAMGAVLELWHVYREEGTANPAGAQTPPMEALERAARHIDFDSIVLDAQSLTVTFLDPEVRLDIGAVAKGYAAERVGQWMLQSDVPSFLISAGGNMRVGNPPLDGRQRWGIGIQDPDGSVFSGANEDILDVLFFANGSAVTSGDYQRFYVADGVRYHHLIDPATLFPADYARSVTIVTEDSGWADMLSTAVFLMDYERGRAFVDGLEGVECFWMLADGSIKMTDGMRAMSRENGASSRD